MCGLLIIKNVGLIDHHYCRLLMLAARSLGLLGHRNLVICVIYMKNVKWVKMEMVCLLNLAVHGAN